VVDADPSRGKRTDHTEQAYAIALAIGVGLLYLVSSWFSPQIVGLFGVPFYASDEYLRLHSTSHVFALALLRLPACLLLAAGSASVLARPLLASLADHWRPCAAAALASCFTAWILDALHIWPWIWRTPGSPGLGYVELLWQEKDVEGLGIYISIWVVANPFLEEVLFRFGILRILNKITRRPRVAAVGSAVAFAIAHFGSGIPSAKSEIVHAVGLFTMGLVLALLTQWRQGRLGVAISVHCARNGLEFISMLLSIAD
jgi:membrane protease YdiL (CAAX protease family)